MNRILTTAAALIFAASTAEAAGFGAGGLKVSEELAKARSGGDSASWLDLLSRLGLVKLKGEAKAPGADAPAQSARRAGECEETKKAEAKKAAEKPGLKAGPEPVYLAF